mmetsp:Transcript_94561/g.267432  ORF Transcript_94561/g.267432 Transcript_94561/m.267432 type:complete len:217 (+) Transcript_94561:116-766(+)
MRFVHAGGHHRGDVPHLHFEWTLVGRQDLQLVQDVCPRKDAQEDLLRRGRRPRGPGLREPGRGRGAAAAAAELQGRHHGRRCRPPVGPRGDPRRQGLPQEPASAAGPDRGVELRGAGRPHGRLARLLRHRVQCHCLLVPRGRPRPGSARGQARGGRGRGLRVPRRPGRAPAAGGRAHLQQLHLGRLGQADEGELDWGAHHSAQGKPDRHQRHQRLP